MKNLIIILIILMPAITVVAQDISEKDVPADTKAAFIKMYPDAINIKWSMEEGKFEAEFRLSGIENSALYDETGKYYQTETEITVSQLPDAAKKYLSVNLPGKKIKEAEKITDSDGKITYEAEVAGTDYLFDSGGSFLSKSTDKEN